MVGSCSQLSTLILTAYHDVSRRRWVAQLVHIPTLEQYEVVIHVGVLTKKEFIKQFLQQVAEHNRSCYKLLSK